MKKPFEKSAPPISYAEAPRLSRSLHVLPYAEQERFLKLYEAHLESPCIVSVQRRGHLIHLALEGSEEQAVYDFGVERNAQMCLTALTDCLRLHRAAVKVLMPAPPEG